MVFQRGEPFVQRAPQHFVPGDKGIHFQPFGLQCRRALVQKFRVQTGFRTGVEVVHGDDGAAPGPLHQLPRHFGRGGGGVDRDGHFAGQSAHLIQREAVIQPQAPQMELLCQRRQVAAAKLFDRFFRYIGQDLPAVGREEIAHLLHAGTVVGIEFFADMQ